MHPISDDRALAQWRALTRLPYARLDHLRERLSAEQPELVRFVIELVLSPDSEAVTQNEPSVSDDSGAGAVGEFLGFGALLNELVRRESGRPLRSIPRAELEIRWQRLVERPVIAVLELASTGPQPSLFQTVLTSFLAAHVATAEPPDPRGGMVLRLLVDAFDDAATNENTSAASVEEEWNVDRIQDALSVQGDPMRREALAVADQFRAQLTPRLLAELESWLPDPSAATDGDVTWGMHALFLLAHWREPAAWPLFRRLFALPGNATYELLGAITTEGGSVLLASVAGARHGELRDLFEDEQADEFCRNAALEALACLVAWNELPRAELVAYVKELLTGRLSVEAEGNAWTWLVNLVGTLEAWELLPEVESAFARELVDESVIDRDGLARLRQGGYGPVWQLFTEENPPIADVAAATDWLDAAVEEWPETDGGEESIEALPWRSDFSRVLPSDPVPYLAPPKVGRNDPCPCGSGKKYKKCCGS